MVRLGVNVDHVATVRQARRIDEPDPVLAAYLAELAGADSIICHLREDRRHIQDRDLKLLRETVKTRLNLEMAPTNEMVRIALEVKPDLCTLVPERREDLTTEGGLNVALNIEGLKKTVKLLHDADIKVSLFIDPDPEQVKASHRCGADIIEIHTGRYAEAKKESEIEKRLEEIENAAKFAAKLKLSVSAGHGLNYRNVPRLLRIEEIEELNIGHSIVARAVIVGFERAVREMKELILNTIALRKSG
jgi:pyridoxine 5-phosphate synthase